MCTTRNLAGHTAHCMNYVLDIVCVGHTAYRKNCVLDIVCVRLETCVGCKSGERSISMIITRNLCLGTVCRKMCCTQYHDEMKPELTHYHDDMKSVLNAKLRLHETCVKNYHDGRKPVLKTVTMA